MTQSPRTHLTSLHLTGGNAFRRNSLSLHLLGSESPPHPKLARHNPLRGEVDGRRSPAQKLTGKGIKGGIGRSAPKGIRPIHSRLQIGIGRDVGRDAWTAKLGETIKLRLGKDSALFLCDVRSSTSEPTHPGHKVLDVPSPGSQIQLAELGGVARLHLQQPSHQRRAESLQVGTHRRTRINGVRARSPALTGELHHPSRGVERRAGVVYANQRVNGLGHNYANLV